MDSSQLQSGLRIARTVMIFAFGIFFICAPFIFDMTGGWLSRAGIATLGAAIIAFELWQLRRQKRQSQ